MNFTIETQSSFKWETKGYSITSQSYSLKIPIAVNFPRPSRTLNKSIGTMTQRDYPETIDEKQQKAYLLQVRQLKINIKSWFSQK